MGQSRRAANRNTAPASIAAKRTAPRSVGKRNSGAREAVILLSGFEPFAGERRNPSREVARALDGELIAGLRVKALELPVVYDTAARLMTRVIARVQPAAVLGMGVGRRRRHDGVIGKSRQPCGIVKGQEFRRFLRGTAEC